MTPAESGVQTSTEEGAGKTKAQSLTSFSFSEGRCARMETDRVIKLSREMLNELGLMQQEFYPRLDALLVAAESYLTKEMDDRVKQTQQKSSRPPSPPTLSSQQSISSNLAREKEFKMLSRKYAALVEQIQLEKVNQTESNIGRTRGEYPDSAAKDRASRAYCTTQVAAVHLRSP